MSDKVVYPAPQPLGPGDSARKDSRTVREAPAALGPADGVREKPAPREAPVAGGPGDGPGDEFESVAFPAFGPGDVQVPRPTVRRLRR